MSAYSLDLREKIVESVRKGVSKAETARRFGVHRATVKRYCKQLDECDTLEPRKAPAGFRSWTRRPGSCSWKISKKGHGPPTPRGPSSFRHVWGEGERGYGLPDAQTPLAEPKKRTKGAEERDEFLRSLWRIELGRIDAERLVFVDEMGIHTSLAPLYAYAPVGREPSSRYPGTEARTLRCLRASTRKGWDHPWRWRGPPRPGCSRPTPSACWLPP